MENSTLLDRFPALRDLEQDKRKEFEHYFRTAPDWLLDTCSLQEMSKGTVFIKEGSPVNTIYFIAKGLIKATDYRIYGFAYDFKLFCKMYALGGMEVIIHLDKYQATLQTVTACTVLRIPSQAYKQWIETDPDALKNESQLMGEYLLETARENRALLFLQGSDRVALLLVTRYRKCAKNGVLRLNRDRQGLSDFTGLCLKSISRSVKKFREAGLLSIEGNYLVVNHEQYLRLEELVSQVLAEEI